MNLFYFAASVRKLAASYSQTLAASCEPGFATSGKQPLGMFIGLGALVCKPLCGPNIKYLPTRPWPDLDSADNLRLCKIDNNFNC